MATSENEITDYIAFIAKAFDYLEEIEGEGEFGFRVAWRIFEMQQQRLYNGVHYVYHPNLVEKEAKNFMDEGDYDAMKRLLLSRSHRLSNKGESLQTSYTLTIVNRSTGAGLAAIWHLKTGSVTATQQEPY